MARQTIAAKALKGMQVIGHQASYFLFCGCRYPVPVPW